MGAGKSNATPRRRQKGQWGPGRWLILGLVALCFAVSSGCAGRPRPAPVVSPPRIEVPANLRQHCLRGRLPEPGFTVGEALSQWVASEARAECEVGRADELLGLIDVANEEWSRVYGRP